MSRRKAARKDDVLVQKARKRTRHTIAREKRANEEPTSVDPEPRTKYEFLQRVYERASFRTNEREESTEHAFSSFQVASIKSSRVIASLSSVGDLKTNVLSSF